ncbi:MAG: DUF3253 domain-containing protein, partial [Verrucomicrobiota bacterium]
CSAGCRKRGLRRVDGEIERVIGELLAERGRGKTICPSEAARMIWEGEEWRGRMEEVRMAARRMVNRGEVEILQKGRIVDASRAKGAIRLRGKG